MIFSMDIRCCLVKPYLTVTFQKFESDELSIAESRTFGKLFKVEAL
jgi:hypothetical protein